MILSCPSCSTRWFVAEDAIPPEGRDVRCASCGHQWRADGVMTLDTSAPANLRPIGLSRTDVERMRLAAGRTSATQEVRAMAAARQRSRRTRVALAAWGSVGAVFAGVLVTAAMFRVDLVRIWPQGAAAFAAVGLDVNVYGIDFEELTVERRLTEDGSVVVVRGKLVNTSNAPRETAPIRIALLDAQGAEVLAWTIPAPQAKLARGEAVPFSGEAINPPSNAQTVEATFDSPGSAPSETMADAATAPPENTGAESSGLRGGLETEALPEMTTSGLETPTAIEGDEATLPAEDTSAEAVVPNLPQ
jgi:predicted Zn finger-like uncharacterized protein